MRNDDQNNECANDDSDDSFDSLQENLFPKNNYESMLGFELMIKAIKKKL